MKARLPFRTTAPLLCAAASFTLLAAALFSGGAPAGRTGAPGDSTCNVGCHSSFDLNSGPGSVVVSTPSEYEPGSPVDVTVTVSQDGQKRFGFEITARDAGDSFVGSWIISGSEKFASGNSEYVTHNPALLVDDSGSWSIQWMPPETGVGDVTFYVAGNAANANFNNQGDYIYTTTKTISQAGATAVERTVLPSTLKIDSVFPNPAVSTSTLRYELMRPASVTLNLYDAEGRLVRTYSQGGRAAGAHELEIPVDGLPGGVYMYRLETSAGAGSGRLLVLR